MADTYYVVLRVFHNQWKVRTAYYRSYWICHSYFVRNHKFIEKTTVLSTWFEFFPRYRFLQKYIHPQLIRFLQKLREFQWQQKPLRTLGGSKWLSIEYVSPRNFILFYVDIGVSVRSYFLEWRTVFLGKNFMNKFVWKRIQKSP